jgi:hypothetical protein
VERELERHWRTQLGLGLHWPGSPEPALRQRAQLELELELELHRPAALALELFDAALQVPFEQVNVAAPVVRAPVLGTRAVTPDAEPASDASQPGEARTVQDLLAGAHGLGCAAEGKVCLASAEVKLMVVGKSAPPVLPPWKSWSPSGSHKSLRVREENISEGTDRRTAVPKTVLPPATETGA